MKHGGLRTQNVLRTTRPPALPSASSASLTRRSGRSHSPPAVAGADDSYAAANPIVGRPLGLRSLRRETDRNPGGRRTDAPSGVTADGKPKVFWAAGAVAVLMIIGGFGPWATVLGALSVSGTNGDGWFLIVGGLAAGALLLSHASSRALGRPSS